MIEGKLIRLGFPEPSDFPLLVKWHNENLQYFFSDEPVSLESYLEWYEQIRCDSNWRFFIVESLDEDATVTSHDFDEVLRHSGFVPVGTIGLQNIDFCHRRARCSHFLIAEEYRGKGYGKDALLTLLGLAFSNVLLALNKVYGEVLSSNQAALGLCEKLGFRYEGEFFEHVWRDAHFAHVKRVAILKSELLGQGYLLPESKMLEYMDGEGM